MYTVGVCVCVCVCVREAAMFPSSWMVESPALLPLLWWAAPNSKTVRCICLSLVPHLHDKARLKKVYYPGRWCT